MIDIGELVSSVKGRYSKKEQGLAKAITVGDELYLPTTDDAYVLANDFPFWHALTGLKGIPFGRIVQFSGRPDSGKSTMAALFMKAAQEQDVLVILWDAEKKFDSKRLEKMGGDPNKLLVCRAKLIKEGMNQFTWAIQEAKKKDPKVKIIFIWDSVAASLNALEDEEEDKWSNQPGVQAKEVNRVCKRVNQLMEKYRDPDTGNDTICSIMVNQVYTNIGSVGYVEKGGEGLYYACSLILQLTRKKDLVRQKNKVAMKYGILTRAKVKKNHLFDAEECVQQLELVVSAKTIELGEEVKKQADIAEESEDE